MQICSPAELRPLPSSLSAEDILDDVSELAVNSPDEGSEDGPHLLLPSPAGHPEDQKTSAGSGQRVGHHTQTLHNPSARMQLMEQRPDSQYSRPRCLDNPHTPLRCPRTQTGSGGFETRSHRCGCLKRLISCIVALPSLSPLSVFFPLAAKLRGKAGSLSTLCV